MRYHGTCIICTEEKNLVKAFPCQHNDSCINCICNLIDRRCAVCREPIQSVSRGGWEVPSRLELYLNYKKVRDTEIAKTVTQVVTVGRPNSGRDQIVEALKSYFPIEHQESIIKHEISCPYEHNSMLGELKARISANPTQAPMHDSYADLRHERAHVLVICVSAQDPDAYYDYFRWTDLTSSPGYTKKLWVLTSGTGVGAPPPDHEDTAEVVSQLSDVVSNRVTFFNSVTGETVHNVATIAGMIITLGEDARSQSTPAEAG